MQNIFLEGAAYGVYSDRGATRENAVFTTDKNGESNTLELEEGMYYVKEKKAPKGYKLDERIYPVTVTSGQTAEVNVKDVPVYSDIELLLDKIDQESKEGKALGGGSWKVQSLQYAFMQADIRRNLCLKNLRKYGCYVPKRRMTSAEVKWEKSIRYPVMIFIMQKMEISRCFRLEQSALKKPKRQKDICWKRLI